MARIKANYVGNLKRHLELDGTLEPTEGTVKTFKSYPEDDPVVVFVTARDNDNWLSGKDWDCEQDCTYLREAMDGCGMTLTFIELNAVYCIQGNFAPVLFSPFSPSDLRANIKPG